MATCYSCDRSLNKIEYKLDGESVCKRCYFQNTTECFECGNVVNNNNNITMLGNKNTPYCATCAEDYFACVKCESVKNKEESINVNDDFLCQECFDEYYINCVSCNLIYSKNNSIHVDTGNVTEGDYCQGCYSRNLFQCFNCQGHFNLNESYTDPDNNHRCNNCFSDYVSICVNCNGVYWADDNEIMYTENGTFCVDCGAPFKFEESSSFQINNSKRFVGFELEYLIPTQRDPSRIKILSKYGKVQDDGSISPTGKIGGYGEEFASNVFSGDLLLETIDKVCESLSNSGAKINKTCGLHVHLDMRRETEIAQENIFYAWQAFEKIFFAVTSISRRGNHFCRSIDNSRTYEIAKGMGRYNTLNVTAYDKHQTFEIRLHQSTLEPTNIKNWVMFLIRFFDTYSKIKMTRERIIELTKMSDRELLLMLFSQIKMPFGLKKYIMKRIERFNKDSKNQLLPRSYFVIDEEKEDEKIRQIILENKVTYTNLNEKNYNALSEYYLEKYNVSALQEVLRNCQCANCDKIISEGARFLSAEKGVFLYDGKLQELISHTVSEAKLKMYESKTENKGS